MNKSSKKKHYDIKRAIVVQQVAKEFEVTDSYVRMIINNTRERKSLNAEDIAKRYNELRTQLETIIA